MSHRHLLINKDVFMFAYKIVQIDLELRSIDCDFQEIVHRF